MIPTSVAVLDLWEAGLQRTPAGRAALLLAATGEADTDEWPVGRRDQALLEAYCARGEAIEALADCPSCGAILDVAVPPELLTGGGPEDAVTITVDEYVVTARLPTVADLLALSPMDDLHSLRSTLLERCVVEASAAGSQVRPSALPDHVVDALDLALDEADPAADIRLSLACEDCTATWTESLDPVRFAWSVVETAARRLATDVHTLAHAYGWSEQEILALSPFRRHLYLTAVGS